MVLLHSECRFFKVGILITWYAYFFPKGDPIQLCSNDLSCIYARNFSSQFMTWFASSRFASAKMTFGDNSSGIFTSGYNHNRSNFSTRYSNTEVQKCNFQHNTQIRNFHSAIFDLVQDSFGIGSSWRYVYFCRKPFKLCLNTNCRWFYRR